jgi:hypothetical protein
LPSLPGWMFHLCHSGLQLGNTLLVLELQLKQCVMVNDKE